MKKRNIALILISLTLIGIGFGWKVSNDFIKTKGYDSLFTFLKITGYNFSQGQPADIKLSIVIEPEHFEKIEQVRNDALERGVIIQPEDPYVPCELTYEGKIIKGEIRLKGKMTDHVSGKKWSFRVKTKKNDAFLGMQRFTLQHPGTRGYVYEWLHHEMCKREGIIALRYEFVNLSINGDDVGVYAVEENFGQPLVQNNQRPKGPIFRFNPTLFWHARLNMIDRVYIAQEFTNFQNAHVEAFSKKETFTDNSLKDSFIEANTLMNNVRWGKVSVADAFDIQKLAMRYALLDLCGGYHSVDWSDVKFYYNPVIKKIEPVAYESFGPRYIDHVIGNYRFNTSKDEFPSDYHDVIFADSTFFSEYIKALRKVSSLDYFPEIISKLKPELDKRVAIQYSEFPYKNFSLEVFNHNLTTIRRSLKVPKSFHAFLSDRTDSSIALQLQGIESLPMEILGVKIGKHQFFLKEIPILESLKRDHRPVFKTISIPLHDSIEVDTERAKGIRVIYKLLGDTALNYCEVFPYPIEEYEKKNDKSTVLVPNSSMGHFGIDSITKTYFFKEQNVKIYDRITIPEDWTLMITSPMVLDFLENGGFNVQGVIKWNGQKENPIRISVNCNATPWITLSGQNNSSLLRNVIVSGKSDSYVLSYGVSLNIENVAFNDSSTHSLKCFNSILNINDCVFYNSTQSAIKASFCSISINSSQFLNSKQGIETKGGTLKIEHSSFFNTGIPIKCIRKEKVSINNVSVDKAKTACIIRDAAELFWEEGKISNTSLGFKIHRKGNLFEPASAEVENVEFNSVEQEYLLEPDNSLKLNGKEMSPNKK